MAHYPDLIEEEQEDSTIYVRYRAKEPVALQLDVAAHYRSQLKRNRTRIVPAATRFVI
ncbi:MAG: hypothetical protein M5U34_08405 [Chloroflexi bacterium]|nr:hypothetical protein [Chloroflexota bacterium]